MNICMMTNTYLPHVGGVARSVQTFVEDFCRRGHRVLVAAPTFPASEKVPRRIERRVARLPALQQFNGSDFSVRLPFSFLLNPQLADFQPHIVHSHHPYLLGDSALRYAADNNVPVIYTHHTLHEQYTHYVPFDSPALKRFVVELCTRYANLCDAVVAPSESVAALLKQRGVTAPIHVVPTGIDLAAFGRDGRSAGRRRHGLPPQAFVVGHLGRLAPEKNLGYLARAIAHFLRLEPRAWFLVVGQGPSAQAMLSHFRARGVAERVVMAGSLSGRPLADAYAAMDAFAFASRSETQGLVLAEAMAAGLPTVALDASGAREVVRDRRNGLLLPARASAQVFARHLQELRRATALRERLRRGARETAKEFSRAVSAAKMIALYRAVLRQKSRKHSAADADEWVTLQNRIKVAWNLVSQKTAAAASALAGAQAPSP